MHFIDIYYAGKHDLKFIVRASDVLEGMDLD